MGIKYEYGPWQVHNGGGCPVEPDTLVQIQVRGVAQIVAERTAVLPASERGWELSDHYSSIAYYRIATEKKPLVRYMAELDSGSGPFVSSVFYETPEEAEMLAKRSGCKLCRIIRLVEDPQ